MRSHKAITPSKRHLKSIKMGFLSPGRTEKALILPKVSKQGRSNSGRITSRFRGGRGKLLCRNIDFWFARRGTLATRGAVVELEYDPARTAYLAVILFLDGRLSTERRYMIPTDNLQVGDVVEIGDSASLKPGNILPLWKISPGSEICCIELMPGRGAQLVRAAGAKAQLLLVDEKHAAIRLPSQEVRLVPRECYAVIGCINTPSHNKTTKGKAGRNRWLGRRPRVRGSAMNPTDHPHGGGEGRCPVGRKVPSTPWGKSAFGGRTRKTSRPTSKLILKPRYR